MTEIILKPREGLMVPLPDGAGVLPDKGQKVQINSYWRRRLMDGDVVEVGATPKKTKPGKEE